MYIICFFSFYFSSLYKLPGPVRPADVPPERPGYRDVVTSLSTQNGIHGVRLRMHQDPGYSGLFAYPW